MNSTLSQRFTAVTFAVVMTLGMLVGVDGLATQDTSASAGWAQQQPPVPARAAATNELVKAAASA
jgi:hypothetical protein